MPGCFFFVSSREAQHLVRKMLKILFLSFESWRVERR